jgi:ABC-type nitrate/sulfonate/bicarbonate transport system substrate-binding protein
MMKKKLMAMVITITMAAMMAAGCAKTADNTPSDTKGGTATAAPTAAGTDTPAATAEPQLSGKKLIVGTMAKAMGLPVEYAIEKGYFAAKGLDIDMIIFATGAPINEAMNAGQLDVAVSGMANVYNLATGNYTYIGDTMISEQGQAMYARPDSDIVKSDGVLPNTKGSAETVKGISILGPLATSAQYNAIKYVQSFGLTDSDFTMVSMEYPQAYQAFTTGEGDLIATTPPYSFQLEDAGYIKVADLTDLMGQPLTDGIYVPNKILEERSADLQAFLEVYYQAATELLNDPAARSEFAIKWYGEEGVTYTDENMQNEIKAQTYTTIESMSDSNYLFGATMTSMGSFFASQGLIEEANVPNIEASFNTDFVNKIVGKTVSLSTIDK